MSEKKEFTLEWFDGEYFPPVEIRKLYSIEDYPPESAMVIGTEGALLNPLGSGRPFLFPEEKFKAYPMPKLENRNHYHHFVDACLGGEMTESHFGQSGPMAEAIILGTVAIRQPGETLTWNSKAMKCKGNAPADKLLQRSYREGWNVAL